MACFTDSEGRQWGLRVDVSALRRVKSRLGINLVDVVGGETLSRLANDPVLLVDVLFVLVEPQAQSRGVDAEAFGAAITGDVLDEATAALLEALADFFPSRKAAVLRRLIAASRRHEETILAEAERMLASGEVDDLIRRAISGKPSTNSPDSSASIPDRSPSGNSSGSSKDA